MPAKMTGEKFSKLLRESAVERFGEERARVLDSSVEDMAQRLASIAEYRLELEEEPAFFF